MARRVAYIDALDIIYQPLNVGKGKYGLAKIHQTAAGTRVVGWYYKSLFVHGFETSLLSNATLFDSSEEATEELIRFGESKGWRKVKTLAKVDTGSKKETKPKTKTASAPRKTATKPTASKREAAYRKVLGWLPKATDVKVIAHRKGGSESYTIYESFVFQAKRKTFSEKWNVASPRGGNWESFMSDAELASHIMRWCTNNPTYEVRIGYKLGTRDYKRIGLVKCNWSEPNTETAPKKTAKPKKTATIRGSSSDRDKLFLAKAPGARISKNGKLYYENRANRADTAEERKTHGIKKDAGLRYAARPHENETRSLDYEWVLGVDAYGKRVYKKTDHGARSCSIADMPKDLALVTHNHPSSASYSDADIHTAIAWGVGEMRVASEVYDYYLKCHPNSFREKGYSTREAYARDATDSYNFIFGKLNREKYQANIQDEYKGILKKKGLGTSSETYSGYANDDNWKNLCTKYIRAHTHETLLLLSKKFGFEYKRIRKRSRKHGK